MNGDIRFLKLKQFDLRVKDGETAETDVFYTISGPAIRAAGPGTAKLMLSLGKRGRKEGTTVIRPREGGKGARSRSADDAV